MTKTFTTPSHKTRAYRRGEGRLKRLLAATKAAMDRTTDPQRLAYLKRQEFDLNMYLYNRPGGPLPWQGAPAYQRFNNSSYDSLVYHGYRENAVRILEG